MVDRHVSSPPSTSPPLQQNSPNPSPLFYVPSQYNHGGYASLDEEARDVCAHDGPCNEHRHEGSSELLDLDPTHLRWCLPLSQLLILASGRIAEDRVSAPRQYHTGHHLMASYQGRRVHRLALVALTPTLALHATHPH